ncbi:DNA-binding protein [Actinosynnema sp. NPDC023587]|uniref:DNA-binding protein n=1 Tax=Actinosynnema sp. NPDC023587 TaxID=3154695 RepID=UPI0033C6FAC5
MATMTRRELLALPTVVNLVTACRAVGIGETKGRELARAGQFPVPLRKVGNRYRASTAELLAYLRVEPVDAQPAA